MSLRNNFYLSAALSLAMVFPAAAQDEVTVDTVLATVNGTEITVGHLAIARAGLPDQYQGLPANVLFDGLLEQLINQTLLEQSLTELPKRVTMLLDNNRRQAVANEALTKLIDEQITEEALQSAYEAEFADFQPAQEFNASHILVETQEEASEIAEKARGGDDFASLAREFSTGPSGPNGGELGWFGQGMMVPPFEAAVMAMEVESISDPVQTQFGWHVIRLNETRNTEAPSLAEVEGDLIANLERDLADAVVADLIGGATIEKGGDIDPAIIMDPSIFEE